MPCCVLHTLERLLVAKYSFQCNACDNGIIVEGSIKDGPPTHKLCPACGATMNRNYRADFQSQDMHIPMHMSSKNTSNKSDFLPTTKDYESPTDPTGEKGFKAWKDDHTTVGFREI